MPLLAGADLARPNTKTTQNRHFISGPQTTAPFRASLLHAQIRIPRLMRKPKANRQGLPKKKALKR